MNLRVILIQFKSNIFNNKNYIKRNHFQNMLRRNRDTVESLNNNSENIFKRMQNQVKRISKKISAVKEQFCNKGSQSARKPQKIQGHSHTSSNYTTARINQSRRNNYGLIKIDYDQSSREKRDKLSNSRDKISFKHLSEKKTPERIKIMPYQNHNTLRNRNRQVSEQIRTKNKQKIKKSFNLILNRDEQSFQHISAINLINKLQKQNQSLHQQVNSMENLCYERCYKLGYMRSYYRENCKRIQQQNKQLLDQNVYYGYLLQFYRAKAKDYKYILCNRSQISD